MARFQVYLSDEGFAEINEDRFVPVAGQSVHEVVLDQLQWYAVERGTAVEAMVTERDDTGHFILEVSPDGSSRLLFSTDQAPLKAGSEPVPDSRPEPGPESGRVSKPVHESVGETDTGIAPEAAATSPAPANGTVIAAAVARAMAAARAVTPEPVRADAPEPAVTLPLELAEQIRHMNALASAGRPQAAYDLASELRQRLTDEAGADDPYAVEARAVEAYFAHLCGAHRESVVLALAVARIRCGIRDRRAPEDVARAVAAWQWLDDERAVVVHGYELLHMWEQLSCRVGLLPVHTELAGRIRRRVQELEAFM